jgi:hypothetical protein
MKKRLITRKRIYNIIKLIIFCSLIFIILRSIYNQQWTLLFASIGILITTATPIFIRRKFPTKIPLEIEIIAIIFLYFSLFLGELYYFYKIFWWWDILLHTGSAIVFGFIGFSILYLMYSKREVKARPLVIAIFSFSFAIAIGVVWEIFEFFMDQSFKLNMQKSGLIDTMWDLIVDAIGAIASSSIAFIYLKTKRTLIFGKVLKGLKRKP